LRDRPDDRAVLASFPGPILVVVGDEDPMLSVGDARALADSALGRLEVVPGAGHLVSLDQPERFNQLLSEFLEECA
jgi:pimeloyl-ACP methyl ester carboxylesterase